MKQRLVVSVPKEHYAWLDDIKKRRGLETVQDAARAIIAESYERDKMEFKPKIIKNRRKKYE